MQLITDLSNHIRELKNDLMAYKLSKSVNQFIVNKKEAQIELIEETITTLNRILDNHEAELKKMKNLYEAEIVKRELCAYYYGAGQTEINYFIRKPFNEVVKMVNDHRQMPILIKSIAQITEPINQKTEIKTSNIPYYDIKEICPPNS